jgi:hypothetical protein
LLASFQAERLTAADKFSWANSSHFRIALESLNDITVNRELTAHLAMEQQAGSHRKAKTAAAFVVGELAGREQARLGVTLDAAEKAFNRFVGVKRFW